MLSHVAGQRPFAVDVRVRARANRSRSMSVSAEASSRDVKIVEGVRSLSERYDVRFQSRKITKTEGYHAASASAKPDVCRATTDGRRAFSLDSRASCHRCGSLTSLACSTTARWRILRRSSRAGNSRRQAAGSSSSATRADVRAPTSLRGTESTRGSCLCPRRALGAGTAAIRSAASDLPGAGASSPPPGEGTETTLKKLEPLGFKKEWFAGAITSGELTHRQLASRADPWFAALGRCA